MNLGNFFNNIMGRTKKVNEDETESETIEDEITDTEESASTEKRPHFLGISFHKLSYKRLPKKFLTSAFLTFNSATLLAGITAIITSLWMLADSKLMSRLTGQRLFVTTLLLIGIFASVIALIGILGFLKKKRKFLIIYIACHLLIISAIFISAVLSFSFFDKITRKIQEDMTTTIMNYHQLDWVTEAWDNTQRHLKCCGIRSHRDWTEYRIRIPQSCCSTAIDKCLPMTEDVTYRTGCIKRAILSLKSHIHTVAIATLFVSATLFGNLFLAFAIRKRFIGYRPNMD